MKYKFWIIILTLILINFGTQSLNLMALKNNGCGYYYFNPSCMEWIAFLLNKSARISLNLLTIWLIYKQFFNGHKLEYFAITIGLFLLGAIDVFFLQNNYFFAMRSHEYIHPIAFSPLVAIILLIFALNQKPNS